MKIINIQLSSYWRSWDALLPRDANFSLGALMKNKKKIINNNEYVLRPVAYVPGSNCETLKNV